MVDLGEIKPSKQAQKKANELGLDFMDLLRRYSEGDWPELTPLERKLNLEAIEAGRNIYARYRIGGCTFIIVTDQSEGTTTITLC